MATYNIHEAKTQLSRLVRDVTAGQEVIIAKAGKPVAKLVPASDVAAGQKPPRQLGLLAGKMVVSETFDDPLPDEILDLFYAPLFPSEK